MPKWRNFAKSVVDVIKLFLEEIWISPKFTNTKKFVLMSEPALKCENNWIYKQIYTLKLFIVFKNCLFLLFQLRFFKFPPKFFITSTTGHTDRKANPNLSINRHISDDPLSAIMVLYIFIDLMILLYLFVAKAI